MKSPRLLGWVLQRGAHHAPGDCGNNPAAPKQYDNRGDDVRTGQFEQVAPLQSSCQALESVSMAFASVSDYLLSSSGIMEKCLLVLSGAPNEPLEPVGAGDRQQEDELRTPHAGGGEQQLSPAPTATRSQDRSGADELRSSGLTHEEEVHEAAISASESGYGAVGSGS